MFDKIIKLEASIPESALNQIVIDQNLAGFQLNHLAMTIDFIILGFSPLSLQP